MSVLIRPFYNGVIAQTAAWLHDLIPSGTLGKYILTVGIVGIGLFGYAASNFPFDQTEILIALSIMIFVAEWAPIKLAGTPLQGTNLSVSAAIAFAALLILGTAGSIVVNTSSALAYCLKAPRPFYKRLFTSATYLSSSAIAGLVHAIAGGQTPTVLDERGMLAAGLAAAAYLTTNSTLISGAVSLSTGRAFRSVMANWQWLFLQMFTSLVIGLLMALAYTRVLGSPGFLLIALLLVFPWYSIYFYVQKSKQVAVQHEQLKQANLELAQTNRALDLRVASLRALHTIGISLNNTQSSQDILQQILTSVRGLDSADTSAIFLDQHGKQLAIAGQVGLSNQYLAAPEMALDGSAIRALHEGKLLVMDKNNHLPAMLSAVAEREGIRAVATIPLNVAGTVVGGLDVCFKSEHVFAEDELNLLRILAGQAAVAIHNAQLMEQVHESYLSTIRALAATVEAKDPYTRGHSEVVRQLAVATGRQLALSGKSSCSISARSSTTSARSALLKQSSTNLAH